MRIREYLIEKSEYLVKHFGDKIVAAYRSDSVAFRKDPEATAADIVSELQKADVKNQYLQWIVRQYIRRDFRLEDLNRVKTTLEQFNAKKRSLEKKDIGQYKKLSDLRAVVDTENDNKDNPYSVESSEYRKTLQTDNFIVVIPLTKNSARYFGHKTEWCTANPDDEHNAFNDYCHTDNDDDADEREHEKGPLHVIIDRKSNNKWQFHNESTQFMDKKDNAISPEDLKYLVSDEKLKEYIFTWGKEAIPLDPYIKVFGTEGLVDNKNFINKAIEEYLHKKVMPEEVKQMLIEIAESGKLHEFTFDQYAFVNLLEKYQIHHRGFDDFYISKRIAFVYADKIKKGNWPEYEEKIRSLSSLEDKSFQGMSAYVSKSNDDKFRRMFQEKCLQLLKADPLKVAIAYPRISTDFYKVNTWHLFSQELKEDVEFALKIASAVYKEEVKLRSDFSELIIQDLDDAFRTSHDFSDLIKYARMKTVRKSGYNTLIVDWPEVEYVLLRNKDYEKALIYGRQVKGSWEKLYYQIVKEGLDFAFEYLEKGYRELYNHIHNEVNLISNAKKKIKYAYRLWKNREGNKDYKFDMLQSLARYYPDEPEIKEYMNAVGHKYENTRIYRH